ncbi:helix-turn-helix transcriptional regulator [Limosilactobacillus sp. STM2_1]|uniref:Helix-turn-helix transcriptional regulator n=1 Tax=Limosilactobacillus rudii TaxID=2759755 RepID=A0A7W3UL84_9LACO|nr:helix-turn-helix domain-containing protein [Limosilactobacillus rudii]MBB1079568.1 helix-turn-helix transcriptional regulator [Limosilactobacillus rudii]MBB1097614.1 helix-turn-helix transcriptional regulator [Limosilactobacillus rudii]MCD7134723.1 helix-turn-helix transcriptional regulator [Limosilactobacillus rudii]
MTDKIIYPMGINLTLKIINGKWKPSIICYLGTHKRRNGELMRHLTGISQKVLTQQLRELEDDGIVKRTNYGTVPPKVVYSLTDNGYSLRQILVDLSIWGEHKAADLNKQGNNIEIKHCSKSIMNSN